MKLYAHIPEGPTIQLAQGPAEDDKDQMFFGANVVGGTTIEFVAFRVPNSKGVVFELQIPMDEWNAAQVHLMGVIALIEKNVSGGTTN